MRVRVRVFVVYLKNYYYYYYYYYVCVFFLFDRCFIITIIITIIIIIIIIIIIFFLFYYYYFFFLLQIPVTCYIHIYVHSSCFYPLTWVIFIVKKGLEINKKIKIKHTLITKLFCVVTVVRTNASMTGTLPLF